MRPLLLLLVTTVYSVLPAQNVSTDLQALLSDLDSIEGASDNFFPALDRTIVTLAFYAAMPDSARVRELTNGAALIDHFAENAAMREFLLHTKLDVLMDGYAVDDPDSLLTPLFNQQRSRSLIGTDPYGVFTSGGALDLEAVLLSVTHPDPLASDLGVAAGAAAARNLPSSPADFVSVALAGLSDWIARRAREELTYSFLDRLREDLGRDSLNHLFPNTTTYLPGLDPLNYRSVLPSIRAAFLKDLNGIAYNLGRYLEARDADSFRRPGVYNLFLLYRILDLDIRNVPLTDIVTFTYQELQRSRAATRRDLDLDIAASTTGEEPTYRAVVAALEAYSRSVQALNNTFDDALASTLDAFEETYDVLDGTAPAGSAAKRRFRAAEREVDRLFEAVEALELPLRTNRESADRNTGNSRIITKWLNGEEAYEFYEAYPTLTRYDELFGPGASPADPALRRAAGLQASRALASNASPLAIYAERADLLERAQIDLAALRSAFGGDGNYGPSYDALQRALQDRIAAAGRRGDAPALRLLRQLTIDLPENRVAAYTQLLAVEARLDAWLNGTQAGDVAQNGVRIRPGAGPVAAAPAGPLRRQIAEVAATYQQLDDALRAFDRMQEPDGYRALDNIKVFEQVFGVVQQLFFLLAEADNQAFVEKEGLSRFHTDGRARRLLEGVTYERIARVLRGGNVHTPAATDLLLDVHLQLADYQTRRELAADNNLEVQLATVQLITNTLERLLNTPILRATPVPLRVEAEPDLRSLADRHPSFADVPALNREFSELFVYTRRKEFRFAVGNLINLLGLLDALPAGTKAQGKFRDDFFRYGTFMADVVAAKDAADIEGAINAIALPAGSSQVKRTRSHSLEVGAYFGAAFAREELTLPADETSTALADPSTTVSLFVPIGLSYSRLIRKNESFTLFASLLDLGAISTFRLSGNELDDGSSVERLPDFSLRNVVAPGLHLLYNIPKSPFSVGIGVQHGPAVRKYLPAGGTEEREARALRFMVTGSVDVPVFRLGGGG